MGILKDGHPTRISYGVAGNLYGEVEVTPPEVDGRGGIDMTSMRNVAWVTMTPKSLKQLNAATARIQFDPTMYSQAFTRVGRNQTNSISFPDGGILQFWGWWDKFSPEGMSESNKPVAAITVQPSNLNSQCVETGPSYTPGSSTICN